MQFSVVIPTCQRNGLLALCLDRLAPGAQTLSAGDYTVIVTDDGHSSTAERMIAEKFPWARWVQGPRRGPAANRNHGARTASSEWIVFCDDDCLPSRGFLEALQNLARADPTLRVIEGLTHADRPKQRMDEVAPVNETGGHLWSCNFAIQSALFEEIGGFDEEYPHAAMEDVDLRERLKAEGVAVQFSKEASICHPWRRNGGLKAVEKAVASHRIFWRKHPDHLRAHPPTSYLVAAIRTLLRRTIPEAVSFRAKGFSGGLCDLFLLMELGRLSLRMRLWPETNPPSPAKRDPSGRQEQSRRRRP